MGITIVFYAVSLMLVVTGIIFKKKGKNKIGNIALVVGVVLLVLTSIPGAFVIFYFLNATTL